MSKYEPRPFIYNLDFLSGTPGILISGYKSFSTLFGLISTVMILVLSVSYILYKFFLFVIDREKTILDVKDNFMTKKISVPLNEFLVAFNVFNVEMTIRYFWGEEIDFQQANFSAIPLQKNFTVNLYYENPENKEVKGKYELETEYCKIGKNINKDLVDKYNFTDYQNYLCLSKNSQNFYIAINETHNTYIDIVIYLKIESSEGYGITEIDSDELSTLYELNYLEFDLYSPNDIISNQNITNPIKFRKNYFSYDLTSPGVLEFNVINTKFIDYTSDNAIILKGQEKFNCFSIDSITASSINLQRFDAVHDIIYSQFRLYLTPDIIESYERTYQKLPTLIADISGVVTLLFTIGNFLVRFFCKIFIETETVSRIFQFKFNTFSKKKLKQNDKIKKPKSFSNESPEGRIKNNLISNITQKTTKINNKDNKNINNYSPIKINNRNSELSFINNNSSRKIFGKKNINDSAKKLSVQSSNLQKNEIGMNNNLNLLNNINKEKILKKYNNAKYLEMFLKITGKRNIENKGKCTKDAFSFGDYFSFIFNKNKNNNTKVIQKLSTFFEDTLSIEEIIERKIYLETVIYFIKMKLGKELNFTKYVNILLKRDSELKQIIEDESKNIIVNKAFK